MSWSIFPQRSTEATIEQLIATGAAGGFGIDPIDGDSGFQPAGSHLGREIPIWTLDKARAYSIAAYRGNPMARAIIDTYTSFAVGDSGLTVACNNPDVRERLDAFTGDPKVRWAAAQETWFRTHLLMGETAEEMLTGTTTGVVRTSPIDPTRVVNVTLDRGNALWPLNVEMRTPEGTNETLSVVQADDITGLRSGQVFWWPSFRALRTDRRGYPFLGPVLDQLDDYDQVLSNLIDRTALMRYLVWDVEVTGDQTDVDNFVRQRGGTQVPASGSVEVHNQNVKWEPKTADVGAQEDATTAGMVLTSIAGGVGLARTWLADPEGSNRATALTMAEPVRRRVGGVQNEWLALQTELLRYVVDTAVAAGRIPAEVPSTDVAGNQIMVAASQTVKVTGPEIAAADAEVTAALMVNLSKSLTEMVAAKILTPEAARIATKKAWEQFVGIPYDPALDKITGEPQDDLADVIDKSTQTRVELRLT